MQQLALAAAAVAGLIHVYFFMLESLWFLRPAVWRRFGLASQEDAGVVRSWAYNQGFYNLFLAGGIAIGIVLVAIGDPASGRAIMLFACGSMVAAGVVLVTHDRAFLRPALIQAVPPAIALIGILLTS